MKIIADAHIPFVKNYFDNQGELILKPGRTINKNDVRDADILLVRSITPVNEALLSDSKVKFVGSITAGSDHLDTMWLHHANIDFALAAGFNAPPVADYVVAIMAALSRRKLIGTKCKVAVIGVGHVGKLVSERLKLLQCDVIECDPLRAENESDFVSIPFDEIKDVDIVTLHVPLTKEGAYPTYHFIDKAFLQRQKKGCVLINASRGAVIDEARLLLHGTHLQWCLDVWEKEPHINQNILAHATFASPHIAGYSVQSKIRGVDMIYKAACEKKLLKPNLAKPVAMPSQQLSFAGAYHHWQDIVLGVFNPIVMTAMMRTKLLAENVDPHAFDEMRNQFNFRHEFSHTRIANTLLSEGDAEILTQLGLHLET